MEKIGLFSSKKKKKPFIFQFFSNPNNLFQILILNF